MKTIEFTRSKLDLLKVAYDYHKAQRHEEFQFEGTWIATAYAKYLIEYLELQFKPDIRKIPVHSDNGK